MRLCTFLIALGICSTAVATQIDGGVARTAFAQANLAMEAGQTTEARDAYLKAVTAAPDWGLAHLGLGVAEQTLDPESEHALHALETAVRLEPENPKAHFHLGLAYERRGRFSDAAKQYAVAVERRPQMTEAQFQLASALRLSGDIAASTQAYESLLSNEPTHIGALLGVAEVYESAGRLEDAEVALLAITRQQPSVAYHQYRLAKFYERIGNPRKAQGAFARADSLKPQPQKKMRPLKPSR